MSRTNTTGQGGNRTALILLALVAMVAIVVLVLYLGNDGRDDPTPAEGAAATETSVEVDGIDDTTGNAADPGGQALENAGADLAEGGRDAASAADEAVERSTDGDNNEPNR